MGSELSPSDNTWSARFGLRAHLLANWLEAHPLIVVMSLSFAYFAATGYLAHLKPLWNDEFFTLYISRAGVKGAWDALITGADQHPPTFYWLTNAIIQAFGASPIVLRLPELVAFWVMLLCLFVVVARKTTYLIAYFAMLFPCTTPLYSYAFEARGYGLLLGSSAAAYLCWEDSSAGRNRPISVLLFGFFNVVAVCSHYYGLLILIPFMIGEVVKFLSRRKIDTALWLAILAPLVPLCLVLPLIQGAHNYSGTFWASPTIANVINSFAAAFGGNSVFFFGVVLVTVLFFSFVNQLEAAPLRSLDLSKGDFSRAEIAVVMGFVALPFFGYLLGYFVTRAFWPRYVIASEIGVVIVFATFLNVFCKGLRILQLALLGLAILSVVFHVGKTQTSLLSQRYLIDNEVRTISRYVRTGLPVLIQDIYLFSQLEFYAPADIKAKIFYPINLEASRQYLGHDTIERGLIDLKPFFGADAIFGENSMPYHQFVSEYSEFYAYRSEIDIGMDWLFYKLTEGDFEIRLVKRYGSGLMFKVSRRHI